MLKSQKIMNNHSFLEELNKQNLFDGTLSFKYIFYKN
jgi:hypothetical protein